MPYSDPEKQRAYMNEWMKKRRLEWIESQGGRCTDCGTHDNLQVDHVIAADKVTHRVWSWAKDRREEELLKCVVRCKPCHDVKGRAMGDIPPARSSHPHGTTSRYRSGCKCTQCRAANAAYVKQWSRKRRAGSAFPYVVIGN